MSRKGYLYRYEDNKFVPYQVIERTVEKAEPRDADYHKCGGKRIMFKVALHHEEVAVPHYQLLEEGFYESLSDLAADILLAEAHKELEKTRKAGMVDGNTIARMRANKEEFKELTRELFDAFTDMTLNSPFEKKEEPATAEKAAVLGVEPVKDGTTAETVKDPELAEWNELKSTGYINLGKGEEGNARRARYKELKAKYEA